MDQRDFILWEYSSRDTIDFKKVYVDMAEDLVAGLLLSQIVYWHLPSKETGNTRLRVEKEGHMWIAKERADWYEEIRISVKQYARAIKILENKDLVIVKKFRFNSQPIPHIRLNWNHFLAFLKHQTEINASKNGFEPYSPMGSDQRDFPERTKGTFPKGRKGLSRKDERDVPLTESTNIDYSQRELTENTKPNAQKIVNNETHAQKEINPLKKDGLIYIANSHYEKYGKGRWKKKDWNFLIETLVDEIMDGSEYFTKANNPSAYIEACLKNLCNHHDLKKGKKEFKQHEGSKIPIYDFTKGEGEHKKSSGNLDTGKMFAELEEKKKRQMK